MKLFGRHYLTIWETNEQLDSVTVIDQRLLPFKFELLELKNIDDFCYAIKEMVVRGAPLIGVTSAYALFFATKDANANNFDVLFADAKRKLLATRPTAVNLKNVMDLATNLVQSYSGYSDKVIALLDIARKLRNDDIEICRKIGEFGCQIIEQIYKRKQSTVNILTHCNAGWLATIDYGTATSPIYIARSRGIPIHVWVDETRPRNQGAKLTAFELLHENVPHTIIVDNLGGLLMQKGMVDLCIVGTDRTTLSGYVANKVGTYLKALAAKENNVPFYVALPSTSIDWSNEGGIESIPIEERSTDEIKYIEGLFNDKLLSILIAPNESNALNLAFDITPPHLVTGLITERGICLPNKESILSFFPEFSNG